jgi:hypothetical protein
LPTPSLGRRVRASEDVLRSFKKHQSLKVSYSDGAYVRFGGNYQSVSVAWQYSWLGWPKFHELIAICKPQLPD